MFTDLLTYLFRLYNIFIWSIWHLTTYKSLIVQKPNENCKWNCSQRRQQTVS